MGYYSCMEKRVWLGEDGVIYQVLQPLMTGEGLAEDAAMITKFAKELRSKNLPVNVHVDGTKIKRVDSAARAQAIKNVKELDADKYAAIVTSVYATYTANFVLKAVNFGKKQVKVFKDKQLALDWLKS